MKQNPRFARFLSDFTLGFSDGLTVPFALTAGLSSLGRTDTVIYGGLAELCAGSISMGIGGYLASRDELPSPSPLPHEEEGDDEARQTLVSDWDRRSDSDAGLAEKSSSISEGHVEAVKKHLRPLGLPKSTVAQVLEALNQEPNGLERAAIHLNAYHDNSTGGILASSETSPIFSGLAISFGYSVGGIIPLLPYLFAATVGTGLLWSACLCLLALFTFGTGKAWVLHGRARGWRCVCDGIFMLILGTLAAGAAVASVKLLEGSGDSKLGR